MPGWGVGTIGSTEEKGGGILCHKRGKAGLPVILFCRKGFQPATSQSLLVGSPGLLLCPAPAGLSPHLRGSSSVTCPTDPTAIRSDRCSMHTSSVVFSSLIWGWEAGEGRDGGSRQGKHRAGWFTEQNVGTQGMTVALGRGPGQESAKMGGKALPRPAARTPLHDILPCRPQPAPHPSPCARCAGPALRPAT